MRPKKRCPIIHHNEKYPKNWASLCLPHGATYIVIITTICRLTLSGTHFLLLMCVTNPDRQNTSTNGLWTDVLERNDLFYMMGKRLPAGLISVDAALLLFHRVLFAERRGSNQAEEKAGAGHRPFRASIPVQRAAVKLWNGLLTHHLEFSSNHLPPTSAPPSTTQWRKQQTMEPTS